MRVKVIRFYLICIIFGKQNNKQLALAESIAVLVNTKQERENFANVGVKFVSRAYDMRCRKLPLITNPWDYTSS